MTFIRGSETSAGTAATRGPDLLASMHTRKNGMASSVSTGSPVPTDEEVSPVSTISTSSGSNFVTSAKDDQERTTGRSSSSRQPAQLDFSIGPFEFWQRYKLHILESGWGEIKNSRMLQNKQEADACPVLQASKGQGRNHGSEKKHNKSTEDASSSQTSGARSVEKGEFVEGSGQGENGATLKDGENHFRKRDGNRFENINEDEDSPDHVKKTNINRKNKHASSNICISEVPASCSLLTILQFTIFLSTKYFTSWTLFVMFLNVTTGFLDSYARAIRATITHVSIVAFIFTYVYPRSIDVEGVRITGWVLKVGDAFLHHIPCCLYWVYYRSVLLASQEDPEIAEDIDTRSPLWNFLFYTLYRIYLRVIGCDAQHLYGLKLGLLYFTYAVCLIV